MGGLTGKTPDASAEHDVVVRTAVAVSFIQDAPQGHAESGSASVDRLVGDVAELLSAEPADVNYALFAIPDHPI